MNALGLHRDRHGPVEVGRGAGILLVHDPLTSVDGHPVTHEVAKEGAPSDDAGKAYAVWICRRRPERERLGAHAKSDLAPRVECETGGPPDGHGALTERDDDLVTANLAHGPGNEVDGADEVREERGPRVVVDVPRRPRLLDLPAFIPRSVG